MQGSWVDEVAATELHRLVLKVLLNECDLLSIVRILDHYALDAARVGHVEDMRGSVQVKGHDLAADLMHHVLARARRRGKQPGGVEHAKGCQDGHEHTSKYDKRDRAGRGTRRCVSAIHGVPPQAYQGLQSPLVVEIRAVRTAAGQAWPAAPAPAALRHRCRHRSDGARRS